MGVFENLVDKTKWRFPGFRFSWEIYTDIILENIADKPYWLDIGAGSNILIEEQPGAEFSVGLDILRHPELHVDHKTGAYVIADSGKLPLKNNSFNFITSRYTFEHLKNPGITLNEIFRVLKPGGTLAAQTTNKKNPLVLLARLIPFRIKKALLKRIFENTPSGTFKTYYRMNTPHTIESNPGSLRLHEIILVEDLLCQSRLLYSISLSIFRIIDKFHLGSFKNNIIVIYKKPEN
ncbi:MAG: class I SAM-dependent methyltransferase [Candidatus Zixiibacteriota bacterium]|nr:MAG: class I SAM-dependent methyltransferase [candidate division Zixibacteria bacterium]